ncbi:MAG TPA: right-handed parallel beta-helix repeat-containing protein [Myxococcaceae bacterium]|jgi:hypothetical protein
MRGWILGAAVLCAWAVLASSCSEEPPAIERVIIDGNQFSNQVRQGVGPISLVVTGRGLQYVESAFLEDLQATVRAGVPDGGVTVDTVIPHGTLPGVRDLTLTLSDNRPILTRSAVVEVTTIRATTQGNDMVGLGTPEHPFRSLTHALGLSSTGDEVELGAGTYGLVNGERWPSENGSPPNFSVANVPDGVIIKGAGSAVTALDGSGLLGSAAALIFNGGGAVEGMTLTGPFHRGILAGRGLVNVTDVSVSGCAAEGALAYAAATLRLAGSGMSGCATGLRALGSSTLDVTNSNFTGNSVGVEFDDSSHGTMNGAGVSSNTGAGIIVASRGDITLTNITVDQNGQGAVEGSSGIYVTGVPNQLHLVTGTLSRNAGSGLHAKGGVVEVITMTVTQNGLDGVTLDGAAQALLDRAGLSRNGRDGVRVTAAASTSLDIQASTLSNNTGSGATINAGSTTIRSSTVDSNGLHGLRVTGLAALALPWTPGSDPQADVISIPPGSINACLQDERTAGAPSLVSVVHASLNGVTIPTGLVAGPVDARPQYRIANSGNQISFSQ